MKSFLKALKALQSPIETPDYSPAPKACTDDNHRMNANTWNNMSQKKRDNI
jgi:hypothetical protein